MNNCILCSIIKKQEYLEDKILFDGGWFIVKAAKGMPAVGHYLIIPKKHINGFAELPVDKLNEIYDFTTKMQNKISKYLGKESLLFEHGSLEKGRHEGSIVHAHLHMIFYNLSSAGYNELINKCKMKKISNYLSIKSVANKDYCFLKDNNGTLYLSHSIDFPRSIIFRVIAKEEKLGNNYEWRDERNNRKSYLEETFKIWNNANK